MIRLEEFMDIFRLKETGYSISSISRITGKDRKTIRKYLLGGKKFCRAII
jgi:transposase